MVNEETRLWLCRTFESATIEAENQKKLKMYRSFQYIWWETLYNFSSTFLVFVHHIETLCTDIFHAVKLFVAYTSVRNCWAACNADRLLQIKRGCNRCHLGQLNPFGIVQKWHSLWYSMGSRRVVDSILAWSAEAHISIPEASERFRLLFFHSLCAGVRSAKCKMWWASWMSTAQLNWITVVTCDYPSILCLYSFCDCSRLISK